MQETPRHNLLSCLQKTLKFAQKKIYLHRIIYIASFSHDIDSDHNQDSRLLNITIDSNIKLINDDYCEDVLTGFGLFYSGFFINIVEGPEETIVKHLKSLINTFDQNPKKNPEITRMKVLLVTHHINKRYYNSWNGRSATPPLLLDKIEQTSDSEIIMRHIHNCIMKLYRMSEYLRNQNPNYIKAAMDNISDLCRQHLPEGNLLDFLLDCPVLVNLREYVEMFGSVPEFSIFGENIWPLQPNFIPRNILGEDKSKLLMSVESSAKVNVKDHEEEQEEEEEYN